MPTEKQKAEIKKLQQEERKAEKAEAAAEKAEMRLQDRMKAGEPVEAQAVAAEVREEIAAKNAPKAKAVHLVAYSDFELFDKKYKTGDAFTVPEGWVHEPGFDTFRSSEFKNKGERDLGMAFTVPGEIINKKTGERSYSRQVLPVKAA